MVLLNIDTLSDSEIRYIAQQEDLEDWDTLSREDLIDSLLELYSDEDTSQPLTRSRDHKYFNTLATTQSDISSLPGVSPVTSQYNETYIKIAGRDSNWVYAYWEINGNNLSEIQQNQSSLFLRVTAKAKGKEAEQSFEIGINYEDNNWNIELPWFGRTYVFSLICKNGDQEEVLCSSVEHYVAEYYYTKHIQDLKDPERYNLLVSAMTSKDGHLVDCQAVREILENA